MILTPQEAEELARQLEKQYGKLKDADGIRQAVGNFPITTDPGGISAAIRLGVNVSVSKEAPSGATPAVSHDDLNEMVEARKERSSTRGTG